MTAAPSVSVVVPVYNGRDSIRELAARVDAALTGAVDWELIFVVDGSPDDSWEIVRELAAQYSQIRGLELSRNFGQHSALLAGIRSARHDIIVTMDDDLQHRPETIPVLLEAMDDDIDLVYGVSPRREHSFWRNVTSRLAKTVMGWTIGGRMLRDSGAFRAFRTPLRTGFEHVSDSYISIDVLLSWVTVRYRSVVTPMDQRESGASNYTVRTLLKHALNMVTGYSSRPLRLVAWLGFGFGLSLIGSLGVRAGAVFHQRYRGAWFRIPRLVDFHPRRRAALWAWCHRRVSRTNALSLDAPTCVRHSRGNRRQHGAQRNVKASEPAESMELIPFNRPFVTGNEAALIARATSNRRFSGDGPFTVEASDLVREITGAHRVFLTTSCTHALEMAALLLDVGPGDEVIMPSFTFVSTANAFVLRGAKPIFVDIRSDTLNIDERLVEGVVTPRTKAIVVMHYAGVACEMDVISDIALRHGLEIVEDNADGLGARFRERPLGTIGSLATLSFHETKNVHCGEGGALLVNDASYVERAEVLREKGTNRSRYFRGEVDKYTWIDQGSSYLPSEVLDLLRQRNFNRST